MIYTVTSVRLIYFSCMELFRFYYNKYVFIIVNAIALAFVHYFELFELRRANSDRPVRLFSANYSTGVASGCRRPNSGRKETVSANRRSICRTSTWLVLRRGTLTTVTDLIHRRGWVASTASCCVLMSCDVPTRTTSSVRHRLGNQRIELRTSVSCRKTIVSSLYGAAKFLKN